MTESGNLELRPWVPGSGICDQLVSMTNNLCGLLSEMRLLPKNCVKNNCNPKVSTFIGEFWRKMREKRIFDAI